MKPEEHPSNKIDKEIEAKLEQRFKPIHDELNEIKEKIGSLRASRKKANKLQPPTISFRLKNHEEKSILSRKAGDLDLTISEYLRNCALNKESSSASTLDLPKEEFVEDIKFLFQFFQKNASNLDINDIERKRINEILTKIKSVK
jgi:DNA-binding Lrp family transcriptional regulator